MRDKNDKPLSYYTNRISIVLILIFFSASFYFVLTFSDHRAMVISLLIALSGSVIGLIVTIASPNHQIEWLDKILDRNKYTKDKTKDKGDK